MTKIKLSLFLSITSFATLWLIMLFTSPIKNVAYAIPFFAALFVLLVSFSHFLVYLRRGGITKRGRARIIILSVFIMLLVMFRSAQALNWVDIIILILVIGGLWFYSSRRSI